MFINEDGILRELTEEEQNLYREIEKSYSEKVEELIRERYSLSDEIALLRQRDVKKDEFNMYYLFAENCKAKAKT